MVKSKLRKVGEAISADLSIVLYLVCLRALALSTFQIFAGPNDIYFEAFGEGTLIHSTTWGAVGVATSLLCMAGVALKSGRIVTSMTMALFVLWSYLLGVYLSNNVWSLTFIEGTSWLLFAYFYISISINRTWGWVPAYARAKGEHPAGKALG